MVQLFVVRWTLFKLFSLVQICALLGALYQKTGKAIDQLKLRQRPYRLKPSIILVPASLISQWVEELNIWGCFQVSVYPKSEVDRELLMADCEAKRIEIIVVSYETFARCEDVRALEFEAAVLDEVHNLKNPKSTRTVAVRQLKTHKRIGLTGTLMQNDYSDIWCVLDIVRPSKPPSPLL